jgi:hypothetical protein
MYVPLNKINCRSQWPRGLRRRSAAARLLRSWVRIHSGFGGLGVCVLASGTQDRGFAPDRSRRIFPAGKFHSMPSFGRGSKIICPMLVSRTIKKVKKRSKRSTRVKKKNPTGFMDVCLLCLQIFQFDAEAHQAYCSKRSVVG